jgi:hypothetical protein
MYVLTLTTIEYDETSVIGVFETMDGVAAAKEAHPCLSGDISGEIWLSWEIPKINIIFAPGVVEPDNVLTRLEQDTIERKALEKATLRALETQRFLDLEQRRERLLNWARP